MLRRFMNWLLHQLQKLLATLSGRRIHSRPSSPAQEPPDVDTAQRSASTITDATAPAEISFSIPPTESSAQQAVNPSKDSIQRAVEAADASADTHMRLDATPSTIPGSPADISSSKSLASGDSLESATPAIDLPPADQLPSIHDLLPAVEEEIKANSAQLNEGSSEVAVQPDEEEVSSTSDLKEPKDRFSELEKSESKTIQPKSIQPENETEPTQALLFSFDITENSLNDEIISATNEVTESEIIPASSDSTISELSSGVEVSPLAEPAESEVNPDIETTDSETGIQPIENRADQASNDQTQLPTIPDDSEAAGSLKPIDDVSESVELDQASLPYPWSIATPKNSSDDETKKSVSQSTAIEETDVQSEKEAAEEHEPVSAVSANSEPAQPAQANDPSTKHGVVKLLFTMKEGNFHGYIEPKDGSSDILFHQKYINEDIFASLERGVEVVVSVKHMEGKAYATQVELAQ